MSDSMLEAMNRYMRHVWADDGTDRPFEVRMKEMVDAHGPSPQFVEKSKSDSEESKDNG